MWLKGLAIEYTSAINYLAWPKATSMQACLASKRFRVYLVQKSHFTDKVTEAQDVKIVR